MDKPSTRTFQNTVWSQNNTIKSHMEIVLDLGFIKLNVQKINDLIHFMFQGFVIKTKQTLSQSKASQPFHTAYQLSKRRSYILLSKSQYNLLYNVAISSNRFVYNVKKFHTKVRNNMYLQYNLFFFFHIKEFQQILCVLSTEQLLTLLRSFPLWQ